MSRAAAPRHPRLGREPPESGGGPSREDGGTRTPGSSAPGGESAKSGPARQDLDQRVDRRCRAGGASADERYRHGPFKPSRRRATSTARAAPCIPDGSRSCGVVMSSSRPEFAGASVLHISTGSMGFPFHAPAHGTNRRPSEPGSAGTNESPTSPGARGYFHRSRVSAPAARPAATMKLQPPLIAHIEPVSRVLELDLFVHGQAALSVATCLGSSAACLHAAPTPAGVLRLVVEDPSAAGIETAAADPHTSERLVVAEEVRR